MVDISAVHVKDRERLPSAVAFATVCFSHLFSSNTSRLWNLRTSGRKKNSLNLMSPHTFGLFRLDTIWSGDRYIGSCSIANNHLLSWSSMWGETMRDVPFKETHAMSSFLLQSHLLQLPANYAQRALTLCSIPRRWCASCSWGVTRAKLLFHETLASSLVLL